MKVKYQTEASVGGVTRVVVVELEDVPQDPGFIGGVIGTLEQVMGNEDLFASATPIARHVIVAATEPGYGEAESSARRFERAISRGQAGLRGRVRRGKPVSIHFSRAEAFAVLARYFEEVLGCRQPVKAVEQYWTRAAGRRTPSIPSSRHIKEARRLVATWSILDIQVAAIGMQRSLDLGPLPTYIRLTRRVRTGQAAN